ncbi:NgoFVII family restriction endonuclease [Yaniella flava]|uniref:NgoFVII family restriction endonuclease n=1 Tax=Yaniella flava TaxID=287930 RepID=A0ABP5FV29_9MICC
MFNAAHPQDERPLSTLFRQEIPKVYRIDIFVGYVSEKSLRYLSDLVDEFPELTISLTCGMHARDGMTPAQHHHALALHTLLTASGRGGVFVIPKLRYHGKTYLFHHEDPSHLEMPRAYIGSANLSAIVPGYTATFETGVLLDPAPEELLTHLERDIEPHRTSIDHFDVPIVPDTSSPMHHVEEARVISTSDVITIMSSPAQYTFHLPLKANAKSSLNAHLGGDGARAQKSGSLLARDWYEGELVVDQKLWEVEGYPAKGKPFTVVTDDGWSFTCKTSGHGGKNLRSEGRLAVFGTWMKSKLIDAGALEYGETATQDNIDRFGRSHLTMKYHPEYGVWSFDLSTTQQQKNEKTT